MKTERPLSSLGAYIEQRMHELCISRNELALKCELSASGIGKIITGEVEPHPKTLRKIAAGLDVPVQQLAMLVYPDLCKIS